MSHLDLNDIDSVRVYARQEAREQVARFARLVISRFEEDEREHTARGGDAGLASYIAEIFDNALQTFEVKK